MLPELTPNKIQSLVHVSTFELKCNRLSHDEVGSNVDRDVSTAYYWSSIF